MRAPRTTLSSKRLASAVSTALAMLIVWSPRLALACPVCMGSQEEASRTAFIAMTAFMTVTPLLLVGGAIGWLWRRMAQREQDDLRARTPGPRDTHAT